MPVAPSEIQALLEQVRDTEDALVLVDMLNEHLEELGNPLHFVPAQAWIMRKYKRSRFHKTRHQGTRSEDGSPSARSPSRSPRNR